MPHLAAAIPDHELSWLVYMTLSELSKAVLCLVLAYYATPIKWAASSVAVWYLTQAADEAMNRNIFNDSLWEYPLLAAFLLLAYNVRKP